MRQMQLTSLEAYDSVLDHMPKMQAKVYEAVQKEGSEGLTLEEMSIKTGIKLQSVCGVRKSLEDDGFLVDSGRKRKTTSNRNAVVWVIA